MLSRMFDTKCNSHNIQSKYMSILNIALAIFLTEMFNKNYPPPQKKKMENA